MPFKIIEWGGVVASFEMHKMLAGYLLESTYRVKSSHFGITNPDPCLGAGSIHRTKNDIRSCLLVQVPAICIVQHQPRLPFHQHHPSRSKSALTFPQVKFSCKTRTHDNMVCNCQLFNTESDLIPLVSEYPWTLSEQTWNGLRSAKAIPNMCLHFKTNDIQSNKCIVIGLM